MRAANCLAKLMLCGLLAVSAGCSGRMSRFKAGLLDQEDIVLVKSGLPAPLLMFDGLVSAYPKRQGFLFTAVQLNTAHGSILMSFGHRQRGVQAFAKAKDYSFRLMDRRNKEFRRNRKLDYVNFSESLHRFRKKDVPYMYYGAQAWLMWVISEGSWLAAADIPRVESLLRRILELDEEYNYGMTHALLGAIYTSRPEALGGRPDDAKKHFESALRISERKCLLVHVLYAKQYARLVYDRSLHDALLKEVMERSVDELPADLAIINRMALKDAAELMETADDYF